jgi:nucleobase:cation symporter-1, NCS1 family
MSPESHHPEIKVPVETRGIDFVPHAERHGKPSEIRWMWSGAVFNVQNVAFGALIPLLMGLSFTQSVIVILVGNLSWFAAGAASLPGPAAGTTAFVAQRAAFGLRGAKLPNAFNWITQILFEISSFVMAVLALIALAGQLGLQASTSLKIVTIIVAAIIQFVLPALGHQTLVKVLNVLVIPFALWFVLMAVLAAPRVQIFGSGGTSLAGMTQGLAFVFALAGFSWMANAADYTRYLPQTTSRWSISWNVAVGGGVPTALLMILGAAVSTISKDSADPIAGLPTLFPAWFVVPYLIFAAVQLFALTSIDLYSSGVTLQALGIKVSRLTAIAVDLLICSTVSAVAIFSDSVYSFITNSLLFVMVWLAAWGGIFIVDFLLRRGRYDTESLFASVGGIYWGKDGFNVPGLIALSAGFVVSLCCINTTIFVGPISQATGGSDLSTLAGFLVGGGVYYALARNKIRTETHFEAVGGHSVSAAPDQKMV